MPAARRRPGPLVSAKATGALAAVATDSTRGTRSCLRERTIPIASGTQTATVHQRADLVLTGDRRRRGIPITRLLTDSRLPAACADDAARAVRLDLSQLEFVDSAGVRALLRGLEGARRPGRAVAVSRRVNGSVEQTVKRLGIARYLWPEEHHEGSVD